MACDACYIATAKAKSRTVPGAAHDGVLAPFGELLDALGDPGAEAGPDRVAT
jgi:hypothetical protein